MITEYNNFKMLDNLKNKRSNILKLDQFYSNKPISIKVPIRFNRQFVLKDEMYIIDKISYKEPNVYDKERRNGSVIVSFKGKYKKELEITSEVVYLLIDFIQPLIITHYDKTIENIVKVFRNS
jgi:hypothetical protein